MTSRLITECGGCGGSLESVLRLGYSPPTCFMRKVGDAFGEETRYPLELVQCRVCSLVQLSCVVDPKIVFHPAYPYSSGNTRALQDNFADLADEATRLTGRAQSDLVVDIGANDGTLLRKFGGRTVGVEPTDQADKIAGPAIKAPFTHPVALRIRKEFGPAKIVTACNVLAHVDNLIDVLHGVQALLAPDGVFVTENHALRSVVAGLQWDTVYHEHLRFFSPNTLERIAWSHWLHPFSLAEIGTHGGSFRTYFRRTTVRMDCPSPSHETDWALYRGRVEESRQRLRVALAQLPQRPMGIGATARATTLINYCGLDVEDISAVCEVPGSDKIGHYIPGTRIPVVDEAALFEQQPKFALLLSWHLADGLIPKLRKAGFKGRFIVPLPRLRIV